MSVAVVGDAKVTIKVNGAGKKTVERTVSEPKDKSAGIAGGETVVDTGLVVLTAEELVLVEVAVVSALSGPS